MPVPDYQTLMRPLLALTEDGQVHRIGDMRDALAARFELTPEDIAERLPSGRDTVLRNRVGWAATYLYRSGLLERPRRAHYRITARGRTVLADHPERVDLTVLSQFEEYTEFRDSTGTTPSPPASAPQLDVTTAAPEDSETPEERMEQSYRQLRSAIADELLERVRDKSWEFFEDLVLDVLRSMGYGGPRGSSEHLGRSGDEGVDGVIREDALGLDLIYVQAKKWTNNVQRPDIQGFYGALEGKRASKGVFITTSDYSPQAREYAASVSRRLVLINGRELAELMLDHGVGVAVEHSYEVKRIDLDYFIEDESDSDS